MPDSLPCLIKLLEGFFLGGGDETTWKTLKIAWHIKDVMICQAIFVGRIPYIIR